MNKCDKHFSNGQIILTLSVEILINMMKTDLCNLIL